MSAQSVQLKPGYQADAKLNITDHANATLVGFPPNGGTSSGAKWVTNAFLHADGPVTVRVAVYVHGKGYTVTSVKVTNKNRVGISLPVNAYRVVLHRVNDGVADSAYPVTLSYESLLAA